MLVTCLTCANCCGLCGPPKHVQMAQPVADAPASGGGGEVVQAIKGDDDLTDADGNLLSDAKDAQGEFSGVHAPLLALDQCMIRV